MQGDDPRYWKTVATAKHFAVHSGPEADRHVFDARVSAHDLADTYLPHFEATVREGRVASIMAAYNRVGGEAAVASQTLLADTLRGRWGFTGYVVGDCGAVADVYQHHKLVATAAAAAALSLRAGTDLDCGRAFASLNEALVRGLIKEADLDRALVRLFTARFRLGLFDPPDRVPWSGLGAETVEAPGHLALARDAAARSIVLLENRGALPLRAVGAPAGGDRPDRRQPARAAARTTTARRRGRSSCSTVSAPPLPRAASRSPTPRAAGWSIRPTAPSRPPSRWRAPPTW